MSNSAKQSVTWGDTAKKRFIKQHGSIDDIPEGDAHAIPKYNSPIEKAKPTPEEAKAAEDSLNKKISELKNKPGEPKTQAKKDESFYDSWDD